MKHWLINSFLLLVLLGCKSKKENPGNPAMPPVQADTVLPADTGLPPNTYVPVDISPMDMCYFPEEYPIAKLGNASTTPPKARVIYSRPHLQGRHVFHEVLKYGEPWRLGANESTELELFVNATIQGTPVKAGRYVLYCIPQPREWKVVLNSNTDSWGLKPDPSKDVASFVLPVTTTSGSLEYFTMLFQSTDSGADLLMAWDNVEVKLPFRF